MKFALLHFPQIDKKNISPSNKLIVKAAKKRGHTMEVINAYECQIDVQKGCILYKKKELALFDAVLVRPGIGEDTLSELALVRQLETSGQSVVNKAHAISQVKNKIWQYQLLKQGKFPIPRTWIIQSKESFETISQEWSYPVVLKTIQGNQGKGVMLAESARSLTSIVDYFVEELKQPIIVQEYIEANGSDIRLFVVGGKVVATMERKAPKGEFRSNAHVSGKTLPVNVTKEEEKLAIQVTKYIGLEIAGVDLIRGKEGIRLLEVNANPGLTFVSKASGVNVSECVVEYVEKVAAK